jgi:hypothetical protein
MGRFVTPKKKDPKYGLQKAGCKRQGLLFLNNNDPVFCTLLFATHILNPFFQSHKPTHVFKTRIAGAD